MARIIQVTLRDWSAAMAMPVDVNDPFANTLIDVDSDQWLSLNRVLPPDPALADQIQTTSGGSGFKTVNPVITEPLTPVKLSDFTFASLKSISDLDSPKPEPQQKMVSVPIMGGIAEKMNPVVVTGQASGVGISLLLLLIGVYFVTKN